ncbi:hypothetical protein V1477_005774 [Vespula maculifrons]|uniref:Uncharacterized protein n=1 Tax=Vespula maculifrons TaxID=7453 RepID=A0ABD2CL79_VESMC
MRRPSSTETIVFGRGVGTAHFSFHHLVYLFFRLSKNISTPANRNVANPSSKNNLITTFEHNQHKSYAPAIGSTRVNRGKNQSACEGRPLIGKRDSIPVVYTAKNRNSVCEDCEVLGNAVRYKLGTKLPTSLIGKTNSWKEIVGKGPRFGKFGVKVMPGRNKPACCSTDRTKLCPTRNAHDPTATWENPPPRT